MVRDVELLSIQYRTMLLVNASGKIERENDPDGSPGPRLWLAGCASGNVAGVRVDMPEQAAAELLALAATEPPLHAPGALPRHAGRYLGLLSQGGDAPRPTLGLLYSLPHRLPFEHPAELINSESEEGKRLYNALSKSGMPDGLVQLGFHNVSEFWPPWCVALHEGEPVSVAFAARLSDAGAEVGVATAVGLRGLGYAAAATAGWARLPSLGSRHLFYGTDLTNVSSQKVAERLGLRRLGVSFKLE